mmetsp:Transcript_22919/g.73700  ORF Transcript_22919/g.73700 Transcript_22919/m.73700 type:complete len:391 (-) Transcript_22919:27-1199(-)
MPKDELATRKFNRLSVRVQAQFLGALLVATGAIFVAGGYDGQKPLNDVWASADGGKSWTRLCRRAPWSPRKGHALLSTDRSLILAGGQGGTSSFGDCWTSDDGASWSLLCLDAPPRHLHAAVLQAERPERDGRRNVLVLGGETSLDDGPAVAHADGWTVEIPPPASTASSPLLAKQQPVTSSLSSLDRPILDVSMRSVVAALAELRQLRAGLREVQRGNVQLCDDVRASTTFDDLQKTLDDKDTDDDALLLEDDERPHDDVDAADHARFSNRGRSGSSRSLSSALTFSARLQRAVAATIGGKFFSAVACQPLAAAAEKSSERSSGHDDDDDDTQHPPLQEGRYLSLFSPLSTIDENASWLRGARRCYLSMPRGWWSPTTPKTTTALRLVP